MSRLDAALAEAQAITADKHCPRCGKAYHHGQLVRYRRHLLWCGVERAFTTTTEPPADTCEFCRGPCQTVIACGRRRRAAQQHGRAA